MGGGGFKKGGSKKKAKKSKKGKHVDKEWNHEGGTSFTGEIEVAQEKKRARRDTQDRDERMRRGRAKIDYAKEQRERINKMKRGISFKKEIEGEAEEVIAEPKEEKVPHIQFKSSRSVLSRLQTFVAASTTSLGHAAMSDEAPNDDTISNDNDNEKEDSHEEEVREDLDDMSEASVVPVGSVPDRFPWFFGSGNSESCIASSYSPLGQQLGMSVFDQLSASIDREALLSSRCSRWEDIPGLYKSFDPALPLDRYSQKLMPYLLSYADIFLDGCDASNISSLERSVGVHIAQHIIRIRAVMQRNNEKLKKKRTKAISKVKKGNRNGGVLDVDSSSEGNENLATDDDEASLPGSRKSSRNASEAEKIANTSNDLSDESISAMQDQGFTRPRILILCPFRSSARRIVQSLITGLGRDSTSVGGLDKFMEEFGAPEDVEEEQEHGKSKPADWKAIFDDNTDDDFKMGIQVTPGQGKGMGANKGPLVRLYSDFYLSDIILASPLGMRLVVAGKENMSYDFLSSVEMTIVHQADILYMQNWDHVTHIFQHLNLMPKHNHDTDFSRVRPYFLEGRAAEHSQLIISSKFNDPLIWNVFRKYGKSMAGHVRFKSTNGDVGCLGEVTSRVKQIFQLIPCINPIELETVRFEFFKKNILGPILRLNQSRTLIVTPSYISYIKVRNELIRTEASAAFVSEYSRDSEISRGRSRFYHGHKNIMVYSGRAHFFRRFMIRGACHIIFYSLPEYAHFYPELVNLIQEPEEGEKTESKDGSISCTVLFTKFEKMALERIVGTKRCEHMLSAGKNTFMFC